jgi:hypothetical protein
MIPAADAMPRMRAGRMNWRTWRPGDLLNSVKPRCGVHPHQMAGRTMTRVAIQKLGTDSPMMAALRAT